MVAIAQELLKCPRCSSMDVRFVCVSGQFLIRFPMNKREVVCWDCGAAGTTKQEIGMKVELTDVVDKFDPDCENSL